MDRVAQDFTGAFCALPDGPFDALMQCAISALSLQERYSLVAACYVFGASLTSSLFCCGKLMDGAGHVDPPHRAVCTDIAVAALPVLAQVPQRGEPASDRPHRGSAYTAIPIREFDTHIYYHIHKVHISTT